MAESGTHVCDFLGCNKAFKKKSRLQIHVLSHTGERPHACSYPGCGKSYPRVDHLQRHIHTAHESQVKEPVWKCEESDCEASFCSYYALKKHVVKHHENDSYTCHIPGCGAVFNKHRLLKSHMLEVHSQGKAYTCTVPGCEKSFPLPTKLKRHMKTHEGYVCSEENCGKKFDKWTMLVKHRRVDHTPVHKCSKCNKTFSQKQWLKQHMLTHAEEREVYVCMYDNCGREYLEKRNLTAHVRSYHDGKRFPCEHTGCGQTFATKQKLIQHQKLHDPNRPLPKMKKKKKSVAEKLTGVSMETESRGQDQMSFKSPNREDCIDLPVIPHLHTGSGDLHTGSGDLHTGSGDLHKGSGDLHKGSGDLHKGSGDLHKGSGDLLTDSDDLHMDSDHTAETITSYVDGVKEIFVDNSVFKESIYKSALNKLTSTVSMETVSDDSNNKTETVSHNQGQTNVPVTTTDEKIND